MYIYKQIQLPLFDKNNIMFYMINIHFAHTLYNIIEIYPVSEVYLRKMLVSRTGKFSEPPTIPV